MSRTPWQRKRKKMFRTKIFLSLKNDIYDGTCRFSTKDIFSEGPNSEQVHISTLFHTSLSRAWSRTLQAVLARVEARLNLNEARVEVLVRGVRRYINVGISMFIHRVRIFYLLYVVHTILETSRLSRLEVARRGRDIASSSPRLASKSRPETKP